MSIIKKLILGKIVEHFLKQKNSNYRYSNGTSSILTAIASESPFMILAFFSVLFFAVLGIYEVLFNSPLHDWTVHFWNSVMSTSPQTIVDIPKQIPSGDSLMQRTIGEWFGFAPSLLADIISIIFSPIVSILGIIIVFAAMTVRLGRHIIGLFYSASLDKNFAKTTSWILLALSFFPLIVDKFYF